MPAMDPGNLLPIPILTQLQAVFQRDPEADCIALVWPTELPASEVLVAVGPHRVRAVYCVSELALREVLVAHQQQPAGKRPRLVLLSKFDGVHLALDVLARLWKNEPQRISPWKTLQQLIRVRDIDPRLTRKHGRWIAEALLSGYDRYHKKITFGDVLDQESAWRAIAIGHLHYQEPSLDLQSLLEWSAQDAVPGWVGALPDEIKANLGEWLAPALPDSHEAVSTILLNGQAGDFLPIALACSTLFSDAIEKQKAVEPAQLHGSRGVFRERYLAGKTLPLKALQPLGDAATALIGRWIAGRSFQCYEPVLAKTEQILASLDMQAQAQLSGLLTCGLQARLSNFARELEAAATQNDGALAEQALQQIETHQLAGIGLFKDTVQRAEMAMRLVRWLKQRPTTTGTAARLMIDYIDQGGFCDWARAAIWSGDVHSELNQVYKKLSEQVSELRERQNFAFGQQLAGIGRGDSLPARLTPVESAIDTVLAPLAEQSPALLLVLDGMSEAVYRQLSGDLSRYNWLEIQSQAASGDTCLVAALPTRTQTSRCSLLSGALSAGVATDEKRAFAAHPRLKKIASTKFPPRVFHKQDLSQPGSGSLRSDVRGVIAGTEHRVLAVVINAIDDQLSSSSQVNVEWGFESIALLRQVMDAAREAGRVVVITSDHGHVLDHDSVFQPPSGEYGERYRSVAEGAPSELEVKVSGKRVLAPGQSVILPWSERLRYTRGKSHGYHGGASLQEVVIPLGVFVNASVRQHLDGWQEVPRRLPNWWLVPQQPLRVNDSKVEPGGVNRAPKAPARSKLAAVSEVVDDMFGAAEFAPAQPDASTPLEADWIDLFLESSVYQQARQRAGRTAISDDDLLKFIRLLQAQQWQIMEATLCRELQIPKLRVRGFLSNIQKLLNVDGYPILSVDRESQTIRLNVSDFRKQFEV